MTEMTRVDLRKRIDDWLLCGREWTPAMQECWTLLSASLAALQDADRLEGENKRLQAEVERLTAQASACPWCRPPVREIFTEAT